MIEAPAGSTDTLHNSLGGSVDSLGRRSETSNPYSVIPSRVSRLSGIAKQGRPATSVTIASGLELPEQPVLNIADKLNNIY